VCVCFQYPTPIEPRISLCVSIQQNTSIYEIRSYTHRQQRAYRLSERGATESEGATEIFIDGSKGILA